LTVSWVQLTIEVTSLHNVIPPGLIERRGHVVKTFTELIDIILVDLSLEKIQLLKFLINGQETLVVRLVNLIVALSDIIDELCLIKGKNRIPSLLVLLSVERLKAEIGSFLPHSVEFTIIDHHIMKLIFEPISSPDNKVIVSVQSTTPSTTISPLLSPLLSLELLVEILPDLSVESSHSLKFILVASLEEPAHRVAVSLALSDPSSEPPVSPFAVSRLSPSVPTSSSLVLSVDFTVDTDYSLLTFFGLNFS
jgi:hypothetical protein